ncbi:hypothetical protein Tco_0195157 [Tanacetum coccineum]|uniref:Uncharacterized protein n=1 Tax=Tanacetum coccineum TaxID=301880 RepID=A0ABQ5IIX9_9ASTR
MLRGRPPIKASKSFSFGPPCMVTRSRMVRLACSIPWLGICNSTRIIKHRVPVRLLALAIAAVCASRAIIKSAVSCRMASKVMAGVLDVDVFLGGILST